MENPNMQGLPAAQPKKSNTPLIIGVVVAVILCCCCIVVIAGGLYARAQVSNVYSSINDQLTSLPETFMTSMPEVTIEPYSPDATAEPGSDSPVEIPTSIDLGLPADAVPQGGLGDDIQRSQAWALSLSNVILSGCMSPVARDTKIEVTEQPDSAGAWKERWTIACDGASAVPVDVSYVPGSNGVTEVTVELVK